MQGKDIWVPALNDIVCAFPPQMLPDTVEVFQHCVFGARIYGPLEDNQRIHYLSTHFFQNSRMSIRFLEFISFHTHWFHLHCFFVQLQHLLLSKHNRSMGKINQKFLTIPLQAFLLKRDRQSLVCWFYSRNPHHSHPPQSPQVNWKLHFLRVNQTSLQLLVHCQSLNCMQCV